MPCHCKIMRIFELMFWEKSYVPLNSEKCLQNLKKKYFVVFLLIRMVRNVHITSILVYCSVQCLFCFKLVILKVQEVP